MLEAKENTLNLSVLAKLDTTEASAAGSLQTNYILGQVLDFIKQVYTV